MKKYLSYGSNIEDEKLREKDYALIGESEYFCDALYFCNNSGYKYCKVTHLGVVMTCYEPEDDSGW